MKKTLYIFITCLLGISLIFSSQIASAQYWAKGTVFLDRNTDGTLDRFDFPQPAVRVNIYRDLDADGVIDGVDTLVATGITNGDGNYEIRIPEGKLLNIRVSNNNDDAEEEVDDGSMDRNSTDLELTEDGGDDQLVGIRFRNVALANAETINQAYITFTVDETNSGATSLTFEGHDVDNSTAFSNADDNISSRARTTADVDWNSIPAWTASRQKQVSPDLTSIVDEVISRVGWASGNALTFIITGSGERTAESHDGSTANAPLLTVDYGSSTTNFIAQVNTSDLSTGASLTTASTLSLSFSLPGDTVDNLNFGYDGEGVGCFSIADAGNILYQINRFSYLDSVIAGVDAPNIEAMTFDRSRVDILGANANRLGIIDKVTGGFTQRANTFGTGGGATGNITFSDVDAIGMDATLDTLWAVFQTRLFVANSSTGAHVANYFGTNIDYITITGTGGNIDDVAVDPTTGTLYATQATTLYTINTTSGAATTVGAMGVSDMEGMTFSENGELYGTTGTGAGASSNSFFSINKSTGSATLRTTFSGEGADFESCECLGGSTLGGILPIYMTRFDVNKHYDHIDINWSAYDDVISTYYLERKVNNGEFQEIAEFNSGNIGKENQYRFEDIEAGKGINYYRIKKVDQQGLIDHSVVKAARINEEAIDQVPFEVFPNPSNGYFEFNRMIEVKVFDANGRLVKESNTNSLDLRGSKPGLYFLEGKSERINKILVIQ